MQLLPNTTFTRPLSASSTVAMRVFTPGSLSLSFLLSCSHSLFWAA
ncbi:unnamed protein product [Protopolystoma xenopodis]|uniref:Uncharacterized protein n=1 Tax=Protopolystoma xenopodis TaxID=117903 RepID=A0A3S5C9H3_9PLAT|nr:unnamed protein product [Protopolystoma xenopodis]